MGIDLAAGHRRKRSCTTPKPDDNVNVSPRLEAALSQIEASTRQFSRMDPTEFNLKEYLRASLASAKAQLAMIDEQLRVLRQLRDDLSAEEDRLVALLQSLPDDA